MGKTLENPSDDQLLENNILNEYFEYTTKNCKRYGEKTMAAYEMIRAMVKEATEKKNETGNECVENVK